MILQRGPDYVNCPLNPHFRNKPDVLKASLSKSGGTTAASGWTVPLIYVWRLLLFTEPQLQEDEYSVCVAREPENKTLWNIPLRVSEGAALICSGPFMERSTHSRKNEAARLSSADVSTFVSWLPPATSQAEMFSVLRDRVTGCAFMEGCTVGVCIHTVWEDSVYT